MEVLKKQRQNQKTIMITSSVKENGGGGWSSASLPWPRSRVSSQLVDGGNRWGHPELACGSARWPLWGCFLKIWAYSGECWRESFPIWLDQWLHSVLGYKEFAPTRKPMRSGVNCEGMCFFVTAGSRVGCCSWRGSSVPSTSSSLAVPPCSLALGLDGQSRVVSPTSLLAEIEEKEFFFFKQLSQMVGRDVPSAVSTSISANYPPFPSPW